MQGVLLETQSGEQVNVPALTYTPYTAGNEPFQIQGNSWLNSPTGQGFGYNHSMHFGWNAALFAGGTATPGMPSLYMGFEDNYYDYSGDLSLGVEWYSRLLHPGRNDHRTCQPAAVLLPGDTVEHEHRRQECHYRYGHRFRFDRCF